LVAGRPNSQSCGCPSHHLKDAVLEPLLDGRVLSDLIAKDTYPVPCAKDREGYLPGYDGQYWLSGLEDYLKIEQVAKRYGVNPRSVFDFGCASGRVIRHFAAQSDVPEIWGSDINRRHIRWMNLCPTRLNQFSTTAFLRFQFVTTQ